MKMVLEEIMASDEDVRVTRGWKVFLMLPRLLLHRPPGGGVISQGEVGDTVRGFHPKRLGVVVGGPVAFVMSRWHCPGGRKEAAGRFGVESDTRRETVGAGG